MNLPLSNAQIPSIAQRTNGRPAANNDISDLTANERAAREASPMGFPNEEGNRDRADSSAQAELLRRYATSAPEPNQRRNTSFMNARDNSPSSREEHVPFAYRRDESLERLSNGVAAGDAGEPNNQSVANAIPNLINNS